MHRITVCLLVTWAIISVVIAGWPGNWCIRYINGYEEAKRHLGTSNNQLSRDELHQIITDSFYRVQCDIRELGDNTTCETCLTPEDIFTVLKMDDVEWVDYDTYNKATTIIVAFMMDLDTECQLNQDYTTLYYSNYTDKFFDIAHNQQDDVNRFTYHQMSLLTSTINNTYRPGELIVLDNGTAIEPDIPELCSPAGECHFKWLRFCSGDVWQGTPLYDPYNGATDDELEKLNSVFLARLLRGDCISHDRRYIDGLPNEEDFIYEVFEKYSQTTYYCDIDEYGFDELLKDLDIGTTAFNNSHSRHHVYGSRDSDDVTTTGDSGTHSVTSTKHQSSDDQKVNSRSIHRTNGDYKHVDSTCFSNDEIKRIFHLEFEKQEIDRSRFIELCPALLQQASQGCRPWTTESAASSPSQTEAYIYGTISVTMITLLPLLCLPVVKWKDEDVFHYSIATVFGLGFGSLIGDTMMLLIPYVTQNNQLQPNDEIDYDEDVIVWKMLCACATVWALYNLQLALQYLRLKKIKTMTSVNSRKNIEHVNGVVNHSYMANTLEDASTPSSQVDTLGGAEGSAQLTSEIGTDSWTLVRTTVLLNALYRCMEGLIIGAAYSAIWYAGLAASIAVFCYELPHTVGSFGSMLAAGASSKRILLSQLLSLVAALVALYIGLATSFEYDATDWILVIGVGMFIYLALADIVPELMMLFVSHNPLYIFLTSNGGILLGLTTMVLIGIFAE